MRDKPRRGALSDDPVQFTSVIKELAQIYTTRGQDKRGAENRIRQRINEAISRNELFLVPGLAHKAFRRREFCEWAFQIWPEAVRELPGYLHNETVRPGAAGLAIVGHPPAVIVTNPNNLEWLREHYLKAEAERQRLDHENAELRQRVNTLEVELEALRMKKKLRRESASDDGKRGGRGHSL